MVDRWRTERILDHGAPSGEFAAVIDASQRSDPTFAWIFPIFILGNMVGTLLLGLALVRSRAVPTWAAAGLLIWPVLHVLGLFVLGNEWPEVLGAALQMVGFGAVSVRLLGARGGR